MAIVDGKYFLCEVGKVSKQRLYVHWGEYNGKLSLNVRYWFIGKDGNEYPTRRGVSVPFAVLKQFAQAIYWAMENIPLGAAPVKPGEGEKIDA